MNPARTHYRRALVGLDVVVTSFPDDRWDDATPCAGWTARMLTGHVIDCQRQVAAMLTGRSRPPVRDATELAEIAGPAPITAWQHARQEVEAPLDSLPHGALVASPLGNQAVDALLGTALIEPLLHSWDLAVAAGTSIKLDADATLLVLTALELAGDTLSATGMYAPARTIHNDMSAQDRLLALSGRDSLAAGAGRAEETW